MAVTGTMPTLPASETTTAPTPSLDEYVLGTLTERDRATVLAYTWAGLQPLEAIAKGWE
jgi:hypothetical protein